MPRRHSSAAAGGSLPGSVAAVEGADEDALGPPADPEEWSDEQWLRWLRATDDTGLEDGPNGSKGPGSPATAMGRITHSPEGQVLGQAMLGLAQAMFGRPDDEIVIVVERTGEPGDDGPVTLQLDEEHPERSRAILRRRQNEPDEQPPAGDG
jgi:hypothetical protein